MIIRIRSNLGTWKLAVASDSTSIEDLKRLIFTEFQFSIEASPEDIILSSGMTEESGVYSDSSSSLQQLDIKHGAMIYITSKLSQVVVEKSFVDEDGNMVEAGTKISIKKRDIPPANASKRADPSAIANTNTPSSLPHHTPATTKSIESSRECEPTLTDEEAIAKLMEEDFLHLATNTDSHHSRDFSSAPDIRAPDRPKSMRLFDEDDTDDMHFGIRSHDDMANLMSQFLNPPARAAAINRHGREPLRTLAAHRTQPYNLLKTPEFEAPVMNQEVLENARAAGLSEEEIQEMFDVEYAERLQADVISNDLQVESEKDKVEEGINVEEGVGGVSDVFIRHHNRYEDLILDEDKCENDGVRLAQQINSLPKASFGGRYQIEADEDFMSREEEQLIQEILASSLAAVQTPPVLDDKKADENVTEEGEVEGEEEDEKEVFHREPQKQMGAAHIVIPTYREQTRRSSASLGVVGRPLQSFASVAGGGREGGRGRKGGGSGSTRADHRKKHLATNNYEDDSSNRNRNSYKNSTIDIGNSSSRYSQAEGAGTGARAVGGGIVREEGMGLLALDGLRVDTTGGAGRRHSSISMTSPPRNTNSSNISISVKTEERLHGRGMRVLPTPTSPSTLHPYATLSRPLVSEGQVNVVPSACSDQGKGSTPSADRERGGEVSGGLNDSMDDEVMAWALKMSAIDIGGTSSAPASSRPASNSSSSWGSSSKKSASTTAVPHSEFSSHCRSAPRAASSRLSPVRTSLHSHLPSPWEAKSPPRSAVSEKAEQLLQRLQTWPSVSSPSSTSSSSFNSSRLQDRMRLETSRRTQSQFSSTADTTRLMRSRSSHSQTDFATAEFVSAVNMNRGGASGNESGGGGRGGWGEVDWDAEGSARSGVDVSAMDEDEQLAYALQQSML